MIAPTAQPGNVHPEKVFDTLQPFGLGLEKPAEFGHTPNNVVKMTIREVRGL